MKILIKQIEQLNQTLNGETKIVKGRDMKVLPFIRNAFVLIQDDLIKNYGSMDYCPEDADIVINAKGKMVFPSWCDSHTHIVYASSREKEFIDRIQGFSYEEIAKRGGGILNSASRLNEISEDELFEQALYRLNEIKMQGTGAVEIKSGYGLSVEGELKMLNIIKKLKGASPLTIKSTFLGAHAIPENFNNDRQGYMDLIINEMLPAIQEEKLADYIDVFCDKGFFTVDETAAILEAGKAIGLKAKIHANELDFSGGVQVGVAHEALSVDHLKCVGEEEIKTLLNSTTIPTLLPSTAFFLNLNYAPARAMIDAGLPIALASDFNPGSSPSGNMSFVLALATNKMKMFPEEAINAATINGACAMELQHEVGSITKGKKANLFITKNISSVDFIPYSFGSHLIDTVIVNGQVQ